MLGPLKFSTTAGRQAEAVAGMINPEYCGCFAPVILHASIYGLIGKNCRFLKRTTGLNGR